MHEVDSIKQPRVVPPLFRLAVKKANPITPLNSGGLPLSLYCVHPIAGDVTSFYDLARELDNSVSLYGIQVPRELMTSAFGSSIEGMARHYVSAVKAFQPHGPIVLGGWSAGAIIALEMAQQLRASGRHVPLLVAFDGAPCNTNAGAKRYQPSYAWQVLCNLPLWIYEELKQAATLSELLKNLRTKLSFRFRRSFPSIRNDQTLHGDAVQTLLISRTWSHSQMAFIRTLYEAMRSYRPQAYAGPVLVFESRVQPLLGLRQVGLAWRKLNPHAHVVVLKSNHMGIFRQPTLGSLARSLLDYLGSERCSN